MTIHWRQWQCIRWRIPSLMGPVVITIGTIAIAKAHHLRPFNGTMN
jgi:hypothetical protein